MSPIKSQTLSVLQIFSFFYIVLQLPKGDNLNRAVEGPLDMSWYPLKPKQEGARVDVGWDIYAGSFYLQVRVPRGNGQFQIKAWSGSGVGGPELKGIVLSPEEIIEEASLYAEIHGDLLEKLRTDRETEGDLVVSDRVTYIGTASLEIWRYRQGVDPERGVRLEMRPARNFSPECVAALALLSDFLGDVSRAKRLSKQFAKCMFKELFAGRRWFMTELDMQRAVFGVEQILDLQWINEAKCYAGEGKSVLPEEQLDRSEHRARRKAVRSVISRQTEKPTTLA
jgi:hypothetical protein